MNPARHMMPMTDPNIVYSGLSRKISVDGHQFHIEIYRLEEDAKWTLEAIDDEGTSTVWDDQFDTDQAALDELLTDIEKQGIATFRESANIIPFPEK